VILAGLFVSNAKVWLLDARAMNGERSAFAQAPHSQSHDETMNLATTIQQRSHVLYTLNFQPQFELF
jgi:hypothetical protein